MQNKQKERNCFSVAHLMTTLKQRARRRQAAKYVAGAAVVGLAFTAGPALAQSSPALQPDTALVLEEVVINAGRADNKTPLTTTTLDRTQLSEGKIVNAVPYMLELQPSVEAAGENGTVGNTSLRIRGVDASRINVNINGITLNDPESQSVFWVNIPNLAGMAQSLQIQRGVGASTGGSASFGAALNLQTLNASSEPYAVADLSVGSWNTRQYGIAAGTGIGRKGFSFDVAYNGLTSDGYVRGGGSDQQSFFASAGYYGLRSLLKAVIIIGEQHTGIAWNGADSATLKEDPTYNSCGQYYDALGNVRYYDKEQDVYYQRHYQLYYSLMLNDYWSLNAAADFTHGDGYDERYKYNKKASDYRMEDMLAVSRTDYILQKKMFNSAFTESLSLRYSRDRLSATVGASFLYFSGDHYGKVLWTMDSSAVSPDHPYEWYRNNGLKKDATVYAKLHYDLTERSNVYADLQYRHVNYDITGTDDDYPTLIFAEKYPFFNPKVGWNFLLDNHQRLYAVVGMNHREPTRADIKDAVNNHKDIKAETLIDAELGYALNHPDYLLHVNAYAMYYKDQLCPSGQMSNSGYTLMENIDKSYRIGVELEGGYRFTSWFSLSGNLTLSTNRAVDYVYHFNDGYTDSVMNLGNTHLALSPSIIGSVIATFYPMKDWKVQLTGKYVGKEYCDNTDRESLVQQAYGLLNLRTGYTFHLRHAKELELQLAVNNLLNKKYMTHASCGDWSDGTDIYTWHYFFQQPGTNFTLRAILSF